MTETSPPPTTDPGAQQADQYADGYANHDRPRAPQHQLLELGELRRTRDDRHVAGVAGGLARYLDIDPIIVRVAFVVLVFFGGSSLLLYAAVWLLVPEEGSPARPLGLDDRNRKVALLGVAALAVLAMIGDFAGAFWFPWPVVLAGLLLVWFLNRNNATAHQPASYANPAPGWHLPVDGSTYGQEPQTYAYAPPRNPRRRGPILFWPTLALIATGIGTLGVIDVAGTPVPGAAYPALALTITAVMLLLGAFWGRAGGLILIGLISAMCTLGATAGANFDGGQAVFSPTTAAQVQDSYSFGASEWTLDLSAVKDVEALDGEVVTIEGRVGSIELIVPKGMDVEVDTSVRAGSIAYGGSTLDGTGVNRTIPIDGGNDVPSMNINVRLGLGQVTIREQ